MDGFESIEDAIFSAAERTREVTSDRSEAITLVYEKDGKFFYVEPQGDGTYGRVKQALKFPKGSRIAALVHNHPRELAGVGKDGMLDHFSPADIKQAQALNVPSYIAFGDSMRINEYLPQERAPRISKGREFNHIPEVKVTAQKIGGGLLARLLQQ